MPLKLPWGIGEYPIEYNRKVHGPFDQSVWYGKRDIPFGELKVAEVPSWIARRNKTPLAAGRAIARAYARWSQKYYMPPKANAAWFFQFIGGTMLFFYVNNYYKIIRERKYKYHW